MAGSIIGALRVVLGMDSAEFQSGADKAKTEMAGIGKAAENMGKVVGAAVGALAAAFALRELGGLADTWSELNARVKNATGSMEAGAATMGRLQEMARRTYSSITQTTEAFLRNSTALSAMGYSTTQQLDLVETLNNALVVSATKGERAASVMDAWSKAMATGNLAGDDLNTVIAGSDRLAKALADSMGINVNQLRAYGAEGKITRDVMYGVTSQLTQLREEADAMPATIGDGMLLIKDAFLVLVGSLDQALGASSSFGAMLVRLGDGIRSMGDVLVTAVQILSGMMAPALELVAGYGDVLSKAFMVVGATIVAAFGPTALAAVTTLSTAIGSTMVGAVRALSVAMMANPLGLLVGAIAAVVAAVYLFRDEISNVIGTDVLQLIKDATNSILGAFVGAFKAIGVVWAKLPQVLGDIVLSTVNKVIEGIETMINKSISGINSLIELANAALDKIGVKLGTLGKVEMGRVENPNAGAADTTWQDASGVMSASMNVDYVSALKTSLTAAGDWIGSFRESTVAASEAVTGLNQNIAGTGEAAGGAGQKARDEMQRSLEALRAALMTEEEAEMASYAKRLEDIQTFYEAGLIQKAEYDDLMERAHSEHTDRMAEITRRGVEEEARLREQTIGYAADVMGSIGSIMESMGDKNFAAAKAFALGEAVINTALGVTKALGQGGMLGFAGAAAVAAAGAAQIATILSARKGSSSRPSVRSASKGTTPASGGSGGTAAQPVQQQSVMIKLEGESYSKQSVEELIATLRDAQKDGHQLLISTA